MLAAARIWPGHRLGRFSYWKICLRRSNPVFQSSNKKEYPFLANYSYHEPERDTLFYYRGGGGIRTHGPLRAAAFQVRWNEPLSDPSLVDFIIVARSVDLERIELSPPRCHRGILPLNYRPLITINAPATHSIYIAAPASIGYSFFKALVVQWIEQIRPKDKMRVRFSPRAQTKIERLFAS